jgi:sec-independent protein translocase protein TatC
MVTLKRRPARDPEGRMSVMDHLRELRRRVIITLIVIGVGAVIAYQFYNPILHFLDRPYCNVPPSQRASSDNGHCTFLALAPTVGFIARLKVSVTVGTVCTAPIWLYQLWAFVTPGLRKNERKWSIAFVAASSSLFALGMALAYLVLFAGLRVLSGQSGSGVTTQLTIDSYLSFLTLLLLVFGSAFELPLLIVMLNLVRVLPYKLLRKWQRMGIFLIFLFAGVATPTADPFTMCAMAVPMVILFEAAVLFCFIHDRRRARTNDEVDLSSLADNEASTIDPIPSRLDDNDSWSSLP